MGGQRRTPGSAVRQFRGSTGVGRQGLRALRPTAEAALALALAGDGARAQALADEAEQTLAPGYSRCNRSGCRRFAPNSQSIAKTPASAIELLQAAAPYELGDGRGNTASIRLYIRGEAYLASGQGSAAAAEFQKILDHRGLVQNCPTAALAHLGLARAYAAQKDRRRPVARIRNSSRSGRTPTPISRS